MENKKNRKRYFWKKVKKIAQREANVVALASAAYAGASSFFLIVEKTWGIRWADWRLLALVGTLFVLPAIHTGAIKSKAPLLIKLARAFKSGFLSLQKVMPTISSITTKMRGIWKNITREL